MSEDAILAWILGYIQGETMTSGEINGRKICEKTIKAESAQIRQWAEETIRLIDSRSISSHS